MVQLKIQHYWLNISPLYSVSSPFKMSKSSGTQFDVTYHSEWRDGYGAQGWKINVAMYDPEVIACTAYTGTKTPTSVLVHDILDHLVSGFWFSGYANEARATAMHGLRNGIEVRSSYEWMADEILGAKFLKEPLIDFLPASITGSITALTTPEETIVLLLENYDLADIRNHIVEGFFRIGLSGIPLAVSSWQDQRLDFDRMHMIGVCLQALFIEAQDIVMNWAAETVKGRIFVGNEVCEFVVGIGDPSRQERIVRYVV